MALYVYRCPECGEVTEETRSIQIGPHPAPLHHEVLMKVVIQTSTIVYGNFEIGDDDFSLRYRNNGASEVAKRNNTQGRTNVNAILRKWGPKGMPLEARQDIDRTKLTKGGVRPPGVESSLEAPDVLSSSYARGVTTSEIGK